MMQQIYAMLDCLRTVNQSHYYAISIRRPIPAKASLLSEHPWWNSAEATAFYEELLTALESAGVDLTEVLQPGWPGTESNPEPKTND
jgi:hypothetical protein